MNELTHHHDYFRFTLSSIGGECLESIEIHEAKGMDKAVMCEEICYVRKLGIKTV